LYHPPNHIQIPLVRGAYDLADTSKLDGEGAGNAAERANALGLDDREAASAAADHADTLAVLDNAVAGDDGVVTTSRRRGLSRGSLGGSISGRRVGRRSISRRGLGGLVGRGAADDGSALAVTLLSDGELLEHGLGLLRGGVDGEDHALTAVVALPAVEPYD
jgi:hypothetical protein